MSTATTAQLDRSEPPPRPSVNYQSDPAKSEPSDTGIPPQNGVRAWHWHISGLLRNTSVENL
ncbi:hypothetical protein EYZ11_004130 [Aspergillus tanneri]|uniref:Uncharacterized protein n=1 Tax=Aspergillus tanneri TaxID=1220188 RepID=A0A4S3JLE6_9EURO|nr:hypothetical protein EYZ11_004130 [Aspergillus tanneri]